MIDYRYEVFLAVASKLSFSKAAQDLFVSQPSISKQIKILEDQIGIALFERKGNSISLTISGKKLLDHLQKAKLIQKDIESEFTSTKSNLEIQGDLKIGASTTISLYVIPKILASFHKQFPKANVLLVNRNSENILKALYEYEVDLAIVEDSSGITSVRSSDFMSDEIIAVCSKNSSFRTDNLELDMLKGRPLALRERGSGTLAALASSLKSHGIKLGDLTIIARLGGTEALKNYLLAGEAIGFLSRIAVKREIESGELVEIVIPGLQVRRNFYFVMRKGEESVGLTKNFIKMANSSL
ncbi:MAG TPA: LysR substrate-binding domain-containing protein [Fulvivirga sp.]|nr:LysR substrate-binding domain-containing protein [Fulvivirga sp.]